MFLNFYVLRSVTTDIYIYNGANSVLKHSELITSNFCPVKRCSKCRRLTKIRYYHIKNRCYLNIYIRK